MKKYFRKFYLFLIALCTLGIMEVNAASGSVRVTSSASNVVVGNTFTVTVTVSSTDKLGSWQYSLNYNSNLFSLVSSDVNPFHADVGNGSITTKSYKYTFKAVASGSGAFSITGAQILDYNTEAAIAVTTNSANVKVMTQQELQASYSKNNNLKGLEVEGFTLTPEFNKDTLEYNLDVPNDTEKVNIVAVREDNKARVTGAGEVSLVEGPNKFSVVVTAENGSTKIYVVNINVLELDPINVTIGKEEYTVVRKKGVLTAPTTFEEKTIIIEDKEVPAFYSSKADLTLVGLNDTEGNVKLYIYNEKENTYQEFKIIELGSLIVYPLDNNENLRNCDQLEIEINGYKIDAYQKNGVEDYYLIRGINLETGKENYYQYDTKEKTLQRYDFESSNEDENFYLIMLSCSGGIILLCLIIILSLVTKKGKKVKKSDLQEEVIKVEEPKKKRNKKEEVKEEVVEEQPEIPEEEKTLEEETSKKDKKKKKKEREKTILDDDF